MKDCINIKLLGGCIILVLIIGFISGTANADTINTWYVTIKKPSFNPPNYLFGPVWTILYILMGITLYLILKQRQHPLFKASLALFFVQLTLNFFWSFIFFKFQLLGIALIEIIFLWLIIIAMITTTYKLNKTAALIQIPYLLWVSFASLLNAAIWYLN